MLELDSSFQKHFPLFYSLKKHRNIHWYMITHLKCADWILIHAYPYICNMDIWNPLIKRKRKGQEKEGKT